MKIRTIHFGVASIITGVPILILAFGIMTGNVFTSYPLKVLLSVSSVLLPFLVLWTYGKASFSNPGFVPEDWRPEQNCVYVYKDRSGSPMNKIGDIDVYYCTKCNRYKPPRSHHCKRCKKCVLRMDHHCFWIGNCVGVKNHRYFIQFLFYVVLSSFYFVVLGAVITIHFLSLNNATVYALNLALVVIAAIIALFVFLSVLMMFLHQFNMLVMNMTTIEAGIEKRVRRLLREKKQRWMPPYFQTRFKNMKSLLGGSFLSIMLPLKKKKSNDFGFNFPVREGYNKDIIDQVIDQLIQEHEDKEHKDDAPILLQSDPSEESEGSNIVNV